MIMAVPTEASRRVSRLENDIAAIYDLLSDVLRRLSVHDQRNADVDQRLDAVEKRLRALVDQAGDGSVQDAA